MDSSSSRAKPELVVLSGPTCAGKTSLAGRLAGEMRGRMVQALRVIADESYGQVLTRTESQAAGAELERTTRGRWLVDAVADALAGGAPVVLDSARTRAQLEGLQQLRPGRVLHVHLTADSTTRAKRFEARRAERETDKGSRFDDLAKDPIEREADELRLMADVVIDTTGAPIEDVLQRALTAVLS